MSKTTIVEVITTLLIILFLYTGISKVMDYDVFKEQISVSPVLAPVAKFIAISLPITEFVTILLLIIPRWRLKGLYTSLTLMILFTSYIITILTYSDRLPCSCGGIIELMSWGQHIAFNSVFICLSIIAILFEKKIREDKQKNWAAINIGWEADVNGI